jgi:hypothetical protein
MRWAAVGAHDEAALIAWRERGGGSRATMPKDRRWPGARAWWSAHTSRRPSSVRSTDQHREAFGQELVASVLSLTDSRAIGPEVDSRRTTRRTYLETVRALTVGSAGTAPGMRTTVQRFLQASIHHFVPSPQYPNSTTLWSMRWGSRRWLLAEPKP